MGGVLDARGLIFVRFQPFPVLKGCHRMNLDRVQYVFDDFTHVFARFAILGLNEAKQFTPELQSDHFSRATARLSEVLNPGTGGAILAGFLLSPCIVGGLVELHNNNQQSHGVRCGIIGGVKEASQKAAGAQEIGALCRHSTAVYNQGDAPCLVADPLLRYTSVFVVGNSETGKVH